jgi:hypothetical protein
MGHSSSEAALQLQPEASSSKNLPLSNVWEIDFCSRPLLDERNKKVWELLICDPDRTFEYSEYFPNSKINSAEVSVGGKEEEATRPLHVQTYFHVLIAVEKGNRDAARSAWCGEARQGAILQGPDADHHLKGAHRHGHQAGAQPEVLHHHE